MYEVEGRTPNFNQFPVVEFDDIPAFGGFDSVVAELKRVLNECSASKKTVIFDSCYGIDQKVLRRIVEALNPDLIVDTNDAKLSEEETFKKFEKFIVPEDRTYGVFAVGTMDEFFYPVKLEELKKKVADAEGLTAVFGVAAGLVCENGLKVYCNLPNDKYTELLSGGLDNWGAGNFDEEPLKKHKRQTFLENPMMEKYKTVHMPGADYYLDFNDFDYPVLLNNKDVHLIIDKLSKRPFQLTPTFLKSIWGGHWIQKVLGVHPEWPNVGWGMLGIYAIQHVALKVSGHPLNIYGIDLLYYAPKKMLGGSIYYKWGYRVPFTISYLDTWGGGNLSLQVHSPASYGQQTFNARAGHHETYYMMDTSDHSSVYLGLKEGTKVSEMVADLKKAQETGQFDDSKYVNKIPMKRHQHVFIPGGTVHCSGEGTLVLELDQYVYATFKLFDWGRIDYDGRPRPVNINHGQYCIQEDFQGDFVYDRLIAKQPTIAKGDGWRCDDTSPIEYEPIDIKRYWFSKTLHLECRDALAGIVLVDGEEATIKSVDGSFEPFEIHYGEATMIPPCVGQYLVVPSGRSENKEVAILRISYPSMA